MADDLTYSGTGQSVPANTKQVTDEHATRGHMPVVKLAISADGDATHLPGDATNGLLADVSRVRGAGSVIAGQQAVTASAVALPANAVRRVTVKALMGNVIPVFVGPAGVTTGTGYELAPNQEITLDVNNTNLLFVIASTTGASVCFIGHP